ncbi:hypothetical protein OF820_06895 [Oceanotoga sp. DSM 15011]|jgi:hypothetical protein|uniref:hypothetical protein n=1 Tax=Oceanotoga TaxID=1255275 RepID=UPI0021F4FA30|nr:MULTISPECIES: hypothetical protein [Oceanotoga]MDN5343437.1 hypothetical protein [Oceanotoga sp.]MDO7976412.1 hypothetical protein [Oceanotoga teriensis]UYP01412.1 hypothetical protein OF820_06895 [Oceanotoga sp. DSM 15011]
MNSPDRVVDLKISIDEKIYFLRELKRIHDIREKDSRALDVIIAEDLESDYPEDWYSTMHICKTPIKSEKINDIKISVHNMYLNSGKKSDILWCIFDDSNDLLNYIGILENK